MEQLGECGINCITACTYYSTVCMYSAVHFILPSFQTNTNTNKISYSCLSHNQRNLCRIFFVVMILMNKHSASRLIRFNFSAPFSRGVSTRLLSVSQTKTNAVNKTPSVCSTAQS